MKKFGWILALCLLTPLVVPAAGNPADSGTEAIPGKELRALLKDDKGTAGPATELIFAMSADEKAKLKALYLSDPQAARKQILGKLEADKQAFNELSTQIRETAKKYRKAGSDTEQTELKAELRKLLTEQFDRISSRIAIRLKIQEQHLAEVRQAYETRQAKARQMIDSRLEKLTRKHAPANKRKKPEGKAQ